jgi:hypothetical protein
MKRSRPGFLFCRERALSSFLSQLSQLFALRFAAGEALLDDRANLLLLIISEIQFPQPAQAEVSPGSGSATVAFTTPDSCWSFSGISSRGLLSLDGRGQGQTTQY